MIIDELIALLGFKVRGLNEVKAATTAMNPLQRNLKATASTTALLAARAGRLRSAMSGLAKLFLGLAVAAGKFVFGALKGALGGLAGLALLLARNASGAGFMAKMFAVLGGAVSRARNEMQIFQKVAGSTRAVEGGLDSALSILSGVSKDTAKKQREDLQKTIKEIAEEARGGDAEALKKLNSLGIKSPYDKNKAPADVGMMTAQAMWSLIDRFRKDGKSRADAEGMTPGKKREAALEKVRKRDGETEKLLKDAGVEGEMVALLQALAKDKTLTQAGFENQIKESFNRNLERTKEENDRSERVAKQYSEMIDRFGKLVDRLVTPITSALERVAEAVLPTINSILAKIEWLIEKIPGVKSKGQIEKEAQEQRERDMAAGRARVAGVSPNELPAYSEYQVLKQRMKDLDNARRNYGSGRTTEPMRDRQAADIRRRESEVYYSKTLLQQMIGSLENLSAAMKAIQNEISPERNMDKIFRDKKTEAQTKEDNRSWENIGNPTLTATISVVANGLEGVAGAVKNAVTTTGAQLIKATTAATAGITAS